MQQSRAEQYGICENVNSLKNATKILAPAPAHTPVHYVWLFSHCIRQVSLVCNFLAIFLSDECNNTLEVQTRIISSQVRDSETMFEIKFRQWMILSMIIFIVRSHSIAFSLSLWCTFANFMPLFFSSWSTNKLLKKKFALVERKGKHQTEVKIKRFASSNANIGC